MIAVWSNYRKSLCIVAWVTIKNNIEPALELLEKSEILYRIFRNNVQGIPMGTGADLSDFKIVLLDVGLAQAVLKFDIRQWILNPLEIFVNKGTIVEAFLGQELLAYSDPIDRDALYYWRNAHGSSDSVVDYLVQQRNEIISIEVKSSASKRIVSAHRFLEIDPKSTHTVRFWTDKELHEKKFTRIPYMR